MLQGERELVADNRSLARFKLRGIPPMPAGMPRVQVQFQIDANGILSVTARELRTDIEQTIEVKPSYGLTDEEVERMLLDSFEHAEADFAARLLIEARNEAESVVHAHREIAPRAGFRRDRADRARAGRAEADRAGARRPEARADFVGPRGDPAMDARAERRDAASRRGDDEPLGAGRAVGEERRQHVGSPSAASSELCLKSPSSSTANRQTVEFEHGKLPYSHHGKPESFLDVAKNFGVPLEHACGGSCACTTCHVIIREGDEHLSEMQDDEADRLDTAWGLTARSRLGCQAVISGDVVCELPMYTRNYVQEGGGIQLGKSDRKERKAQEVTP